MKKFSINKELVIVISGITLSLLVNWLIYRNDPTGPIGKLQNALCYFLPGMIALLLSAIGFVIICLLRGKSSFEEWGREQAKAVLSSENSLVNKSLARTYLIIVDPIIFFGAWLIGSIFFGMLIFKPILFAFCLPAGIGAYYLQKKFPQK